MDRRCGAGKTRSMRHGFSSQTIDAIPQAKRCKNACVALALTAVQMAAHTAHPATNTVYSLLDSGPGSLRDAIACAAARDSIAFGVEGTIALTGGEISLTRDVAILGPGALVLTLSGSHSSRLFTVHSNIAVRISGLTLTEGQAPAGEAGGAVYNAGELTMSACVIAGNAAGGSFGLMDRPGGSGGGIYNRGLLTVENSIISGNRAGTGAAGGNQHLYGNAGWSGGNGGGICSEGTMSIVGSSVSNNFAGSGGSGGSGQVGGGSGGLGGSGGGLFVLTGMIENCSIVSNAAGDAGMGGPSSAGAGGGGNGGNGGGIIGAVITVTNCTIVGNRAGGGGEGGWRTSLPMSQAGGGPGGDGGGIHGGNSNQAFVACTIAGNRVGDGGFGGTSQFPFLGPPGRGGGIAIVAARAALYNSIVASNTGPTPDVYGTFHSMGHNLIGITNGSDDFNALADLTGSSLFPLDPRFEGLVGDGHLTVLMALSPNSPAVNAGAAEGSPEFDQRGVLRPQGLGPDIGSYEYEFRIPRITGVSLLSPSGFWIQASGLPSRLYALQASANLTDWSDLIGLFTSPHGLCEAVDLNVSENGVRCFRLRSLGP